MTATGLPDASCDAAISLDMLPFVSDKAAAFAKWRAFAPTRPVRVHQLGATRVTSRR
jgi:hypothetical protein